MKLRPRQPVSGSSKSTPAKLLPANTGVAKTRKNNSTSSTPKTRGTSSITRRTNNGAASSTKGKMPKPAKKAVRASKASKASTRAKPSTSSRKKPAPITTTMRAATPRANIPASKLAINSVIDPAVGVATSPHENKTKAEKRECVVCTNSKYPGRNEANFSRFSNCDHEPLTCTDCITKHALIKLKARRIASTNGEAPNFWSAITCPQCNVSLAEADIRSTLSRKDLKAVTEMVSRNELYRDKRWVWCASETCSSGKLHTKSSKHDRESARKVTCSECGVKTCFAHREVWHEGLTCAQYDDRNPKTESLKSSEERIKNMTKKCPTVGCEWRIQKEGGCSSMYCPKCEQYFVWSHVRYDKDANPEPEIGAW